jgi:hypothetical protein
MSLRKPNLKAVILTCALSVVLLACSDENGILNPDNELGLISLGTSQVNGVRIELAGSEQMGAGYNPLEIKLTEAASGRPLSAAQVTVVPMMNMGDHSHSAPSEPGLYDVDTGVYDNPVVFLMPGTWVLEVSYATNDGKEGMATFTVDVGQGHCVTLIGDDEERYFLSLVAPLDPSVGKQDIEFTVHGRESMMSFPPIEDFTVEIEPSMPAMGHGSPDNEQPVHQSDGHYVGKVNFIMTGAWRVDVRLKRGEQVVAQAAFDLLVK